MSEPASIYTVRTDCVHCAATGKCLCGNCAKHGDNQHCAECRGNRYRSVSANDIQERPCGHCKGEGKCGCHTCLLVLLGSSDSLDLDALEQLAKNERKASCSICRGHGLRFSLCLIREAA